MLLALKDVSAISVKEKAVGMEQVEKYFAAFAAKISKWAGSSTVFILAAALILVWGATGPYFGFSASWQMILTTGTTICTFLMVLTIQNSQNRDGMALQIKLNEIIRATGSAQNRMINLEELSHQELEDMKHKFAKIGQRARKKVLKDQVLVTAPAKKNT